LVVNLGEVFYDYSENAVQAIPNKDLVLGQEIFDRIIVMLINEAYDALFLNIASKQDIDLAMTKGVNYPKGLIQWSEDIGLNKVLSKLTQLFNEYGEDRYRPNVLLKRIVTSSQ
jgi:3-hydroxybutyryl-CoA dehydrogenase